MARTFDLIVIGTGAGGQTVAYECSAAGWDVAIVDSRRYGGTCALRGCDPKKVLVGAADLVDWYERMADTDAVTGDVRIDWPALMQFKRTFTEPVPAQVENGLGDAGVTTVHGRAQFVDTATLEVDGETISADNIIIATGAKPRPLHIPGAGLLASSTDFLDLETLPERIVFVGGGYISLEFANVAVRAGANVTILHRSARALKQFDADMVDYVVDATRAAGVSVTFDAPVTAVEHDGEAFVVHSDDKTYVADLVVHGAGRVPEINDLNLDAGSIEHTSRGVVVNDYLQSVSNSVVYACGDAAANGPPLTPVAGAQGRIVAANLLDGNENTFDPTGIPTVLFSIPPLASVGLSEAEARDKGLDVAVKHQETSGWYSSQHINEQHSAFKTVIENGSRRIVGAHLFGHHAEEVINIFALAIRNNLTADDLADMIYAYPTNSSNMLYML